MLKRDLFTREHHLPLLWFGKGLLQLVTPHRNKRTELGFKKQTFNHSTEPNYFRKPLSSNVTYGWTNG